jgi:hypothetical protein
LGLRHRILAFVAQGVFPRDTQRSLGSDQAA